jgi:hypothetical protein
MNNSEDETAKGHTYKYVSPISWFISLCVKNPHYKRATVIYFLLLNDGIAQSV